LSEYSSFLRGYYIFMNISVFLFIYAEAVSDNPGDKFISLVHCTRCAMLTDTVILTRSTPAVLNCCCLKGSAPYSGLTPRFKFLTFTSARLSQIDGGGVAHQPLLVSEN